MVIVSIDCDSTPNEELTHEDSDIFAAALAVVKLRRQCSSYQVSIQADAQLDSYYVRFSSKTAPAIQDELEFWDNNADFSLLKDVAVCVLSIPATSAPVERTFSIAGNILADERLRLSDSNLENQIMIKVNKTLFSSLFFK